MRIVFDLFYKSEVFEVFNYFFAGVESVETVVSSAVFIYEAFGRKNIDFFKRMTFTHFKIVRIMSRGYFNHTCSEFLINIRISDNRNFAVD